MRKFTTTIILILLIFLACEPEKILPEFKADFVMSSEAIEVGDTITFGEKVEGFPVSYRWLFEGGTPAISNAKSQTVTYGNAGTYQVTLWVESDDAREDSVIKTISVSEGLTASFSAEKTVILQDSSLQFLDTSTGDPDSWSWFFPGAEPPTSSLQNPVITYPDTGTFSVNLVVAKGEKQDSISWTNYIRVVNDTSDISANDSTGFPAVNCDANPTTGVAPLEVFFIAAATDPNGNDNGLVYSWDFKDGNTATGNKTSHIFSEGGEYEVELTVRDTDGNEVKCQEITIAVEGKPGAPSVTCNAVPDKGPSPLNVGFSAAATDPDGDELQYLWDFGDGDTSSLQTITHTYTEIGEYIAEVTVIDEDGLIATCQKTITVTNENIPPTLSCSISPESGQAPLTVEVSAAAQDPDGDDQLLSYEWNFGGLATSTNINDSYIFDSAGTYVISLTVTDENGGKNSCESTITVIGEDNQLPLATCQADPTSGVVPLTVNFIGQGADPDGTIVRFLWDFGDGSSLSELKNPTHQYTQAGTYTTTLVIEDNSGATDTCLKEITVLSNECPTASMEAAPLSGAAPLEVSFSGAASEDTDGGIVLYEWTFGDGMTGEGISTTHTYEAEGQFTALLTVTDNNNCKTTTSATINVGSDNQCPLAVVLADKKSGVRPLSVDFDGSNSTDLDGTLTSYSWNFGDGNMGTGPTISHTFTEAGTFIVTLEVTDDGNCSVTDTSIITVKEPLISPQISCAADPTNGNSPLAVNFSANATDQDGFIVSYEWDFGDGTISTEQNPTHIYATGTYQASVIAIDNDGLRDTCTQLISATAAPNQPPTVAQCNASPLIGQSPLTVNFTSIATDSDGTIASYAWNFGDGSSQTGQNVSHTYTSAGTYVARVTAEDNDGATASCELTIIISSGPNSPPSLSCLADKTQGKEPLTVNFSSDASDVDGTIASYQWNFGDGNTNSQEDPSHTFESAGVYNVRLVVLDNEGDSAVCTNTITVNENQCPLAVIQSSASAGQAPLSINFNGTNSTDLDGSIASYNWTFGDGSTASGSTVSHTFTSAGTYQVRLTVADDNGCENQASTTITVSSTTNAPPLAVCQSDKISGKAPLTVAFDGANSTDEDGAITEYTWDFGDESPLRTGINLSHTYNAAGTYTVTLTVVDDDGAPGQCSLEITVGDNSLPTASCEVSPTTGNTPLTVSASGSGSSDSDGTIVSYSWNFGDGTTLQGESVSHEFTEAGTYTVTLTVTDNDGGEASCSEEVSINGAPVAVCAVSLKSGEAPLTINVNGLSSTDSDGAIAEYTWDFGDGSLPRTGVSLTHLYTTAGIYIVTLTVQDDDGATAQCTETVTVSSPNQLPIANCGNIPENGVAPLTITFDGSASSDPDGTIATYAWDFGNGDSDGGTSVTYTYTSAGTFTAKLVVTDNAGGKDSCEQQIVVTANDPPVADCQVTPTAGNSPLTISVDGSASTDSDGMIESYVWDFGDGGTFSGISTTYTYAEPGTYTVKLLVTDNQDAKDSCTQSVRVNTPPVADCNVSPISGEAPLEVSFDGTAST
ncbi:MAG: PKD domain-containing protein, partial [Bacteroidota bacterium]